MMGDLSIACKLQEKHVYPLHPRGCFVSRKNLSGSTYLQATTQHSGKAMKIGKFTPDVIRKQQDIKGKQFTTWIMLNLKLSHSQTNLLRIVSLFKPLQYPASLLFQYLHLVVQNHLLPNYPQPWESVLGS